MLHILFYFYCVYVLIKPQGIQKSMGKNHQNSTPVPSLDKLGGLAQEGHLT